MSGGRGGRRARAAAARGDGGVGDGGRRARGSGGEGRTAEESSRRQEAAVAVENFDSLTALCHKWPPVSRSEPRTGEMASFIPPF